MLLESFFLVGAIFGITAALASYVDLRERASGRVAFYVVLACTNAFLFFDTYGEGQEAPSILRYFSVALITITTLHALNCSKQIIDAIMVPAKCAECVKREQATEAWTK
jgi:hypothetical protein